MQVQLNFVTFVFSGPEKQSYKIIVILNIKKKIKKNIYKIKIMWHNKTAEWHAACRNRNITQSYK